MAEKLCSYLEPFICCVYIPQFRHNNIVDPSTRFRSVSFSSISSLLSIDELICYFRAVIKFFSRKKKQVRRTCFRLIYFFSYQIRVKISLAFNVAIKPDRV